MSSYHIVFGLLSAALMRFFWPLIYHGTDWHSYFAWVAAMSATAFVVYGLDKLLSVLKITNDRAPEDILHLLAFLGGFPGAWIGRAVFHHKTNIHKHPDILGVLILSTVIHLALIYFWFWAGD